MKYEAKLATSEHRTLWEPVLCAGWTLITMAPLLWPAALQEGRVREGPPSKPAPGVTWG